MSPTNLSTDPTAEEQAALWAARLEGGILSAESQQELDIWLETNPLHRSLLSEYCQLSADLEAKLSVLLAEGRVELEPEPRPINPRAHRRWWALSGSLAAAAAVALAFWLYPHKSQYESLATPAAQRETRELADGSQIELDARTSLRVEIDADQRRMRLAEGEVFLAVAKDPSRPFVVETPVGSITVKGTKFDVRAVDASSLSVTVLEGVVQVSPAQGGGTSDPVLLTVGDQLELNAQGLSVHKLSAHALDDAIAWRHGQVVFDGAPLRVALARFARHHGIGITASPEAAGQRIGGRFSLDDLDAFFSALEEVIPVRVSRNLNGTVQVDLRTPHAATVRGQ